MRRNAAAGLEEEMDPTSARTSFTILIPAHHAGAVIGKGGSVIKEMQASSGAQIQLSTEAMVNR